MANDYQPQAPLGMVGNPLGDVINGMLQGHYLALSMQQQQNANQEAQTRQALGQQQIQQNDETARQNLMFNARPVNASGMVQLDPSNPIDAADPRLQAMAPTVPAGTVGADGRPTLQSPPSTEAAPQEPFKTTLGLPEGSEPYTVNPPETPAPAAAPANPSRLPQVDPSQLPGAGGKVWVKADASRLIKHKDSQGNVFQGELYTPQEQGQRQLAVETAKLKADRAIPNAKDVPTIQKEMLDNEMVAAPTPWTLLTGQRMVRRADLPVIQERIETTKHDIAEEGDVQSGQTNSAQIAAENRKAAEARAKATQDSANARNAATNATRLQIAGTANATRLQIAGMPARSANGGGETPTSQAKTKRETMAEIGTLANAEDNLNTLRSRLATAIGTGKLYVTADVDDKGKVTNSKTAAISDDDDAKGAQIADMQERYAAVSSQLKNVLTRKNEAYAGLGVKGSIPIEEQLKAIDTGTAAAQQYWENPNAKPAAVPKTPPPATPPPTTKTPAANQPKKEVPTLTTKGGKTIQVGSQVPLANGKTATIKKLYADGTFDY